MMGQLAHDLFALGLIGDLELPVGEAGIAPEPLGPGAGRLIEGTVVLAPEVVNDGGLECLPGARQRTGESHGQRRSQAEAEAAGHRGTGAGLSCQISAAYS